MNRKVVIEYNTELAIARVSVPESLVEPVQDVFERIGHDVTFDSSGNGHSVNKDKIVTTYVAVIPLSDHQSLTKDIRMSQEYMAESLPEIPVEVKDVTADTKFL